MSNIRKILKQIELHDSTIESVTMRNDGSVKLILDIDEVWNEELGSNLIGILFKSVYEISNFKIDRFNVIGSVEIEEIEGYHREFVTHCESDPDIATMVSIELVAGGSLNIICSGSVELLQCSA